MEIDNKVLSTIRINLIILQREMIMGEVKLCLLGNLSKLATMTHFMTCIQIHWDSSHHTKHSIKVIPKVATIRN
jgi:hypothetical protein